eukprot:TRINITY_DN8078_c0_g1_i1.p1 TRINITY_DN8078_c0_g1~~TRINITY_DN8078_c0_g1_i1.p1  ORF type:complete len:740 (+),score=298.87 TRINITY_DN8078_c0_g1_i1:65-2284(+)
MSRSPRAGPDVVTMTKDELMRLQDRQQEHISCITRLTEQNKSLSDELDKLSQTIVSLQVKQHDDEGHEKKRKSRLDGVRDKLKSKKEVELQAEIDILRARLLQSEAEGGRTTGLQLTVQALQESNREYAEKSATSAARCEELEQWAEGVAAAAPDAAALQALQAKVGVLEPVAARVETAEGRAAGLQSEVESLTEQLRSQEAQWEQRMQEQHVLADQHLAAEKQIAQRASADLNQTVQELRVLVEQKDRFVSEAMTSLSAADRRSQAAEAELATLRAAHDDKARALAKASEELHAAQQVVDRAKHSGQERDMERDLRKEADLRCQHLQEELEQARSQEVKQEQERESALRETVQHQRQNIDSLKEAVRMRDEDVKQLRAAAAESEEHAAAAEGLRAELEQVRGDAAEAAEQSKKELADARDRAAEAAAEAARRHEAVAGELESATNRNAELQRETAVVAELREAAAQFEQRLADQEGEHRIQLRKRDGLIRELRRDLATAATAPPPPLVQRSPAPSPRAVPDTPPAPPVDGCDRFSSADTPSPHQLRRQSGSGSLPPAAAINAVRQSIPSRRAPTGGMGMIGCAVAAGSPVPEEEDTDLERENNMLIQRCAELQQDKWRLDDRVAYLEEDNRKKTNILDHWVQGPAAAQLVRSSGDALLRRPAVGSGWRQSLGFAGGSSVSKQVREKSQEVLQDALAENIRIATELEEATAEIQRLRAALVAPAPAAAACDPKLSEQQA